MNACNQLPLEDKPPFTASEKPANEKPEAHEKPDEHELPEDKPGASLPSDPSAMAEQESLHCTSAY